MQNERHLVVEEPDGSVAIAFNEEVAAPPPPLPPPEMYGPRPRRRFRFLIEYHPVVRGLSYIFIISSGINLALFMRTIDIINFVLIVFTTGALHTEDSASIGIIVFHGTCAGLMIVPFCVLRMWEQAIYQFSIAMMCITAFNTCTQIDEEIPEV
jgi:hypothetical protein